MARDALISLLAVVGIAALALWLAASPSYDPGHPGQAEFDRAEASEHVERLAARPRPTGSLAHRESEEYLVDRLGELGLEVEVQATTSARVRGALIAAARVRNVVGRLPGSGDGSALLLTAHYDSRPHTPGAGDDASGVATILETLRVVTSGPSLSNDLVVLFSDAEEVGLLGAEAFAAEHRWMADVEAVLNFEGRGNRGPSVMFETGPGSGGLVRELARSAPAPMGNSLSYEIYQRMPNDTDFSVFKARGLPGLNFAFIGNLPAYHSPLDSGEMLAPETLGQQGANALALARRLGDLEIAALPSTERVYFNPIGAWMVTYPAALAQWLALFAAALLGLALVQMRRRGVASWAEILAGAGAWFGTLVLAPVAVWIGWNLLGQLDPDLQRAPNGAVYPLSSLSLAAVLLVVAVAVAVFACDDRRSQRTARLSGVLIGWALPALATARWLPGASYLFAWPLLAGAVTLLAIVVMAPSRAREIVPLVVPAAVAAPIFVPTIDLLFQALTLELAWAVALFAALAVTLAGPLLAVASRGRAMESAAAIALVAVTLATWVVFTDEADAERPRTDGLFYVLDSDAGEARWLSPEAAGEWSRERLGEPLSEATVPDWLNPADRLPRLRAWPAATVDLQPPKVSLIEDVWEDERRWLTVGVASQRGASTLWLSARSLVEISGVRIDDRELPIEISTDRVRILYFGLPAEGLELGFATADRQPVELHAADQTIGIPALEPVAGVRGSETIVDPRWSSDSTFVSATVWN